MKDNEIKLKAIAALTALRADVDERVASDLLGEVIPDQFEVPMGASAEEAGLAVLSQLSAPLSALVNGFVLAFETIADAYDGTGAEPGTELILQELALRLARENFEGGTDSDGEFDGNGGGFDGNGGGFDGNGGINGGGGGDGDGPL
ncbi:hypothetical protein [Streptomyces sp. NPDC003327]